MNMGLFDIFSGGGGSLSVRMESMQVSANGALAIGSGVISSATSNSGRHLGDET